MTSFLQWSDTQLEHRARELARLLNQKYLTEGRKKDIKHELDHILFETVMRKR